MRLDASNLPAFARGCAVLGAGGGGDPALALVMALRAVEDSGAVEVLAPADLPAETLVMPCGAIGAPALAEERIWSGDEGRDLRREVESLCDAPVGAMMAFQIGGASGVLPVTWAARTGLPLLDGDGMGRTLPGFSRQTMRLAGIPAAPIVLVDGEGGTLAIRLAGDDLAERLAEDALPALGGACAAAAFCMTAADAHVAMVRGSLSRAIAVGDALERADPAGRIRAVVEALGGAVLADGRLVDVNPGAGESGRGSATVRGARDDLRLESRRAFLVALSDGELRAAVPDVIAVLDAATAEPVAADRLRHGRRVVVIAAPGPPAWDSPAGRAVAGPEAFGYDIRLDTAGEARAGDGGA